MKSMKTAAFALAVTATVGLAQGQAIHEAVDISKSQIDAVLKFAPPAVDQQLRVVDLGELQLAVGIVHRGKTGAPPAGGAGRAGAGKAGAPAPVRCGITEAPAGSQTSQPGMISHDFETETYIVTSGEGTLVTGGQILNGSQSGPESEVTKILNGVSCSGRAAGKLVTRHLVVGDVVIIPAGVPHGWSEIADHVDYLSVRPDPKKVLEKNYVNPHMSK
jgi:mannose-6-phosphate isomerase-like protein (cupin superfamily)